MFPVLNTYTCRAIKSTYLSKSNHHNGVHYVLSAGFAIYNHTKFAAVEPLPGLDTEPVMHWTCLAINTQRCINMYASPYILALMSTERFLLMRFSFWSRTGITFCRQLVAMLILAVICVGIITAYLLNSQFEYVHNTYDLDERGFLTRVRAKFSSELRLPKITRFLM